MIPDIRIWDFIGQELLAKRKAMLLYVLESQGSSPGRKGFCMALKADGNFTGTIGGGIMEVKLLELAKKRLSEGKSEILIKRQIHHKGVGQDRSGLICSGEQVVALIPLSSGQLSIVTKIMESVEDLSLMLTKNGLVEIRNDENMPEDDGEYHIITIKHPKTIHIFGGGHVGLALSRQMSLLGYRIILYEDRPDLSTLKENSFGDEILIIDYENISKDFRYRAKDAVVIVTFSYRSDKLVLKQLYDKNISYVGMMGSDAKINQMRAELEEEGITDMELSHVHMPIGIGIYSKSASEIAVSIAAQLIQEQNKDLPTGRSY